MTRSFSISATVFSVGYMTAALCLGSVTANGAEIDRRSLIERTGERVKRFWDELSSVACTESLLQEKLDEKNKVVLNNRAKFDYLITLRFDGDGLLVDESRLPMGQPAKRAPQGSLLATQGFATLLLIFHPDFQRNYTFLEDGEGMVSGRRVMRVQFLPHDGSPSPAILALKSKNYPIAWEGIATIDQETAMIMSIDAHWKNPAEEIGLRSLAANVHYAPAAFKGSDRGLWLPAMATVEVVTQHQHWRNTHRFADYRLFSVDSQEKIGGIKTEK
jgi:hypothetical protein